MVKRLLYPSIKENGHDFDPRNSGGGHPVEVMVTKIKAEQVPETKPVRIPESRQTTEFKELEFEPLTVTFIEGLTSADVRFIELTDRFLEQLQDTRYSHDIALTSDDLEQLAQAEREKILKQNRHSHSEAYYEELAEKEMSALTTGRCGRPLRPDPPSKRGSNIGGETPVAAHFRKQREKAAADAKEEQTRHYIDDSINAWINRRGGWDQNGKENDVEKRVSRPTREIIPIPEAAPIEEIVGEFGISNLVRLKNDPTVVGKVVDILKDGEYQLLMANGATSQIRHNRFVQVPRNEWLNYVDQIDALVVEGEWLVDEEQQVVIWSDVRDTIEFLPLNIFHFKRGELVVLSDDITSYPENKYPWVVLEDSTTERSEPGVYIKVGYDAEHTRDVFYRHVSRAPRFSHGMNMAPKEYTKRITEHLAPLVDGTVIIQGQRLIFSTLKPAGETNEHTPHQSE